MTQAVRENVFPGAVLLVSKHGAPVFFQAYGVADVYTGRPVKKETVFDLASLTKPCATTPAVMRLLDMGKLSLAMTLGELLAEFKNTDKENITVEQLLTHTAGFPDYQPYYKRLQAFRFEKAKQMLRDMLVKEPVVYKSGTKTVYSDLGFMILSWIIEDLTCLGLDAFVEQAVFSKYGLDRLFFPGVDKKIFSGLEFAATENCPWRKTVLTGVVHDDNAFSVGGVDGHAGLFGTAENLNIFLSHLISEYYGEADNGLFQSATLQRFFHPRKEGERALGFDVPSPVNSSSGRYFSKRTIGHLGFTGTSFWMDLERAVIVILLTNRVHPTRKNERIRNFRPRIHDEIMKNI